MAIVKPTSVPFEVPGVGKFHVLGVTQSGHPDKPTACSVDIEALTEQVKDYFGGQTLPPEMKKKAKTVTFYLQALVGEGGQVYCKGKGNSCEVTVRTGED